MTQKRLFGISGAIATAALIGGLLSGCMEKDLPYRRITGKDKNAYVWMEAKKYIDANENTAIITLHNEKIVQNTVIKMERELIKKEQDIVETLAHEGIHALFRKNESDTRD